MRSFAIAAARFVQVHDHLIGQMADDHRFRIAPDEPGWTALTRYRSTRPHSFHAHNHLSLPFDMYRHGQEEIDAVANVLKTGQSFRYGEARDGHTRQAEQFEAEWSAQFRVQHSCFTSSGMGALLCYYAALGIGPGDEVIVPGYTWIATALAPLIVGAIPILVDVDETLTLNPAAIERAITPRTMAICPVHMNGCVANMDRILEIARKHSLYVVEDACHCDGGRWKDGRRMGTLGDMGAFSFN